MPMVHSENVLKINIGVMKIIIVLQDNKRKKVKMFSSGLFVIIAIPFCLGYAIIHPIKAYRSIHPKKHIEKVIDVTTK